MAKLRGNAIVGQSGGPTAVINQSLVGVIETAHAMPEIEHLFGARHGVKGILGEDFVELFKESQGDAGSCRRHALFRPRLGAQETDAGRVPRRCSKS